MARATFRICYLPGRRLRSGRSQPHRVQRRIAWFFWRELGWFEHIEDAVHCVATEARQQRDRRPARCTAEFDAEGMELRR
ncbi:hypothetical protein [Burkholderia cenocepacia]|uniref:hypothetical protein n=1 Tax=Burkholderia cenocepacia TaxID=95486 RepID=UPI002B245604|nr:hypothetical protein [Burkholderia cenocepacia]MEB2499211.1 hypothetical protein [Burkholderia cenocepacia]MEB2556771.1 hypothetical protein [Burkholderia cenocepacia]